VKAKNFAGMIMTLLGIALMVYGFVTAFFYHPYKIYQDNAILFIIGSYLIIAGPGFWIGEVPKEVVARVRKEALGAKEAKKE
jgi:uncharacterized membrane protein